MNKLLPILLVVMLSGCGGSKPQAFQCTPHPNQFVSDNVYFEYKGQIVNFIDDLSSVPKEYVIESENDYSFYAKQKYSKDRLRFHKKTYNLRYKWYDSESRRYVDAKFICNKHNE